METFTKQEQEILFDRQIMEGNARSQTFVIPWATYMLVGINTIIFVALSVYALWERQIGSVLAYVGPLPDWYQTIIQWGAITPDMFATGQIWRLFTYMFLHIGLLHLFFNMIALLDKNLAFEKILGTKRFVFIYLVSGLFGGVGAWISTQIFLHSTLVAGASAAIYGVFAASFFFKLIHYRSGEESLRRKIVIFIVYFFLLTFIGNYFGHVFGVLAGMLLILLFLKNIRSEARRYKTWKAVCSEYALQRRKG